MSNETKPSVELRIPILKDMELVATNTADVISKYMQLSEEESGEISMALIEATINAFEHSESQKDIFKNFTISDDELTIKVIDQGKGFDSEGIQIPDIDSKLKKQERKRGWGVMLIKELMDSVDYESGNDGTTLTMTKKKKKTSGAHSQISSGFEEFLKMKRVSTFAKFRAMRGGLSNRASLSALSKNTRRPSILNVARSDWDVFYSEEHNREYYHNRKTGETRWMCPPEVLAALESQKSTPPCVAIAIALEDNRDHDIPAAKTGGGQTHDVVWKEFTCSKGPYYCNSVTREVSWVVPQGAIVMKA